jgi:hypothetical protein
MPNAKRPRSSTKTKSGAKSASRPEPSRQPKVAEPDALHQHADALFRTARECCHQHDRYARVLERASLDLEERAVQEVCRACDNTLTMLVEAYESAMAAATAVPDDDWRRKANALWLASREFTRRHHGTNEMTRRLVRHSAGQFEALHTEFELEASALLSLRHACDAYQKMRPEAV